MRRNQGFTLLEVVIVVLVLGIMAAAAVPAMNGFFTDEKINGAADSVVTAIYYARTMAITTGVDHRVNFDPATESFSVEKYTGGEPPSETFEAVENPLTKRNYTLSFGEGTNAEGVDLCSATFGADQFVRFGRLGEPKFTGSVVIEYGGRQRTVSVTATSCTVTA